MITINGVGTAAEAKEAFERSRKMYKKKFNK